MNRFWVLGLALLLAGCSHNGKCPFCKSSGPAKEVLFDGTDLSKFQARADGSDAKWVIRDGYAEVNGTGDIVTKEKYKDFTLHVEFWLPLMAEATGQARSNSGVFLGGRYEVQILDTYGHPPEDNGAGAIYKVATPRVNASLVPEQWQSYDIQFRAARMQKDGKSEAPRVTVVYNGVKIHDDVELKVFATPNNKFDHYALSGPILLQNHHAAVKFRNIWLVEKR